ncbi:MAG: DUF1538 domain-containing protein [Gammaproteobacteria bacterium]|nr:DUF1538 domain-containing protein [Gammaproteobacteria bacterium]
MNPSWIEEIVTIGRGVTIAVTPLVLLFLLFQVFLLRLPLKQVADVLKGVLIAAAGLFLFLVGVGIAFLPFGRAVGEALGALEHSWLFAAIGVLLGFLTAWGEPAVRVLADQVEDASNGSIRSTMVLLAICMGVAVWVGIGMLRISHGIPLLWLLVPGYGLVLLLMGFSSREFVAIAADAGGVATGPLANSFLLALALGASSSAGGQDPILDGFGLVSLIALAPIMSVMALGLLVELKMRKREP